MLDEKYLQYGLDALSRAHLLNYFADGHRGAAIIAAYFFCHEVQVEPGVSDILRVLIDNQWVHTPLCEPFPSEGCDAEGIERILAVLEGNISYLRQAGHNVIFPTMALKAFSKLPELITPSRVQGICKLIEAFSTSEPLTLEPNDEAVNFNNTAVTAEFIFSELLRTIDAFDGRGQGWTGHLLTYGRALLDLRQLGYIRTAKLGEEAFSLYIKRIRMGPLDTDRPRPEHKPGELLPYQSGYWELRRDLSLNLGHSIKYPYGFYGFMPLVNNHELVRRCLNEIYHIF
jgi:hypothetical protein